MPLLPIPACVDSVIPGKELKEGMVMLCIIIIIFSIIPILLVFIFCQGETGGFTPSDPVSFSTFIVLVLAVVVLVLVKMDDIDPIVHFVFNILWVIITVWVVLSTIYLVLHNIDRLFDGICGIAHILCIICFIVLVVCMVYGVFVYWSFYVESD